MDNLLLNGGVIGSKLNFKNTNKYLLGYETLAYVGGYVYSNTGSTSNITISLTSLTGGTNSSPQVGDIVIIGIELGGVSNLSYRIAGYTTVVDLYADDSYDSNLQVGYKIMGATPDSSITITGGTGNSLYSCSAAIHVWRNFDTINPIDYPSRSANLQTNTAIVDPSPISPPLLNSQLIVVGSASHNAGDRTYTASYLNNFITKGTNGTSIDTTIGMGNILWEGGSSYNPAAFVFSGTDSTSYSCSSIVFALQPAAIYGNYQNSGIWNIAITNF